MNEGQSAGSASGGGQAPGWYTNATGQMQWWDGSQWGQLAPAGGAPAALTDNARNMAILVHVSLIVLGVIGPLIFFLINNKPDADPYERKNTIEALNFGITVTGALFASFILVFVIVGFLLIPVVAIAGFVFPILGAIAASKGEVYKYPVSIRLVSGGAV